MHVKFMYIPIHDIQNHLFCGLNILVEKIGHYKFGRNQQEFIKTPKVFQNTNKIKWFKTLGTTLTYSPMSNLDVNK